MTSGRSGKKVMRRKPSASHCVHRFPEDWYNPDSCVLSAGLMETVEVSVKGPSGGRSSVRPSSFSS
eukprot:scaffold91472_cov31-Tisochrysis_lutea.AAC.9